MQWVVGQEYRTRGGNGARIYATDGGGEFPIHGAIWDDERWRAETWTQEGSYMPDSVDDADLLPPRPPVVVSDRMVDAFYAASGGTPDGFLVQPNRVDIAAGIAAAISVDLDERGE